MTLQEFEESLSLDSPPPLPMALVALWYDGKGDWHGAHEQAQADSSSDGAWVHAYLHRKEGDISNAGYWYRRAGKSPASGDSQREWEEIAEELLR